MTVLLTTHDLDEAERVADHVVIVVGGRLVADGTVDELTHTAPGRDELRFRAPAGLDRRSLGTHLGDVGVTETAPGEYLVSAAPEPRTVAALTAWLADHDLPLADLRAGRQRLEDVYLHLTGAASPPDDDSPARSVVPATDLAGRSRGRWRGTGRRGGHVRPLVAQVRLEMTLVARNGESLLAGAFGMLLLLVFFSLVEVLPHGAERSVDFLVPGVLSLSIMSVAMGVGCSASPPASSATTSCSSGSGRRRWAPG